MCVYRQTKWKRLLWNKLIQHTQIHTCLLFEHMESFCTTKRERCEQTNLCEYFVFVWFSSVWFDSLFFHITFHGFQYFWFHFASFRVSFRVSFRLLLICSTTKMVLYVFFCYFYYWCGSFSFSLLSLSLRIPSWVLFGHHSVCIQKALFHWADKFRLGWHTHSSVFSILSPFSTLPVRVHKHIHTLPFFPKS